MEAVGRIWWLFHVLWSIWVLVVLLNMLGNFVNLPDGHAEYVSKLPKYGGTLEHVWKF